MILAIASVCLLLAYAVLISFYFRHWKKLPLYQPSAPAPSQLLSVIVAARNEEKTLPALVHDLRQQQFPAHLFEVIIVDDFSTDKTAAVAHGLPPNMRMVSPSCAPQQSSKKKAIATGVAQARGELLLITDADCRVGKNWVATVASFHQQTGALFIAAPVKYTYQNKLVQWLQVLDFLTLQGITAASVAAGFHNMCNGANLAYTKKAFESVNGFAGIDKIPTGDDMLLMHKIWKQHPTGVFYLKSKEAVVTTAPMQNWKEFILQRRRWASKTLVFDDYRMIAVLAFVLLLNLWCFVLLTAGFYQPVCFFYLLLFLLGKTLIEWPFVYSVASFFGEQRLMRYFLFLQPLHVFYTVVAGVWSQFGSYRWKDRMGQGPVAG